MKSPLEKLRRFALRKKIDVKEERDLSPPSADLDELAHASQDMQDMRDCYDGLLSAAAATANSAFEFSESLQEMGSCLLDKTTLHEDEESCKILLLLGEVQFQLQKLADSYRSHIFMTITNPSESLLNEIRTVEDMRRQCDEKRTAYEHLKAHQKGSSKSGKGESLTVQQLERARAEYDDAATLFVFRLKSLKQGQPRSLLAQVARHHAAQLNFFRKGLKSLEAVDPSVKLVTEEQHIDYQFSALEDDGAESGEVDIDNSFNSAQDGKLTFDYRENNQGLDVVSTLKNPMELDGVDAPFPQASVMENSEVNINKHQGDHAVKRDQRVGSHSAPLVLPEGKSEPLNKIRQVLSSTIKSNSYVLPTPIDAKSVASSRTGNPILPAKEANVSVGTYNIWNSSPLEQRKHEKDCNDSHLEQKESNVSARGHLPLPLKQGTSFLQLDTFNLSEAKKTQRQSFSGPLPGQTSSARVSTELPQTSFSPRASPNASPPPASPIINELHELPRPPANIANKAAHCPSLVGHSAPLMSRNPEATLSNKILSTTSNAASRLPTPPLTVSQSFSVRSSTRKAMEVYIPKQFESHKVPGKANEFDSPPLTPISFTSIKPISTITELVSQSGQIRGGADR